MNEHKKTTLRLLYCMYFCRCPCMGAQIDHVARSPTAQVVNTLSDCPRRSRTSHARIGSALTITQNRRVQTNVWPHEHSFTLWLWDSDESLYFKSVDWQNSCQLPYSQLNAHQRDSYLSVRYLHAANLNWIEFPKTSKYDKKTGQQWRNTRMHCRTSIRTACDHRRALCWDLAIKEALFPRICFFPFWILPLYIYTRESHGFDRPRRYPACRVILLPCVSFFHFIYRI